MTAFNDYCIVCDQLIPQQSPNAKQKLACKNKKHSCSSDKLLYCSEQCQLKDKCSIHASLESMDTRNSSNGEAFDAINFTTLDDTDSLITSPLLLPMDNKSGGGGTVIGAGNDDAEDDASIYRLMNMESASTVAIPRSSDFQTISSASSSMIRNDMIFDCIPENNYKIWLDQHQ